MLEASQAMLFGSTVLMILALAAYLVAVLTARTAKRDARVREKVSVGVGTGAAQDQASTPAEPPRPAGARGLSIPWFGTKFTQITLLLLTGTLLTRFLATGHAPFASHYEFALSFAWGMTLAHVYFEWRYKVRTLALVTIPVILATLLYADTLSYEIQPLMPALQNSPLLTMHVFSAAVGYGAAVVAFAAAVMYLLAPHVRWHGWPREEALDDLGYKATMFTFPMLTLMLILGAIWANIAWGRYWNWDPKETSALVTWLIYGAYLHARVVRDWRGNKSAWLLVLGFAAVVFTYMGNLFFGGMHAYV